MGMVQRKDPVMSCMSQSLLQEVYLLRNSVSPWNRNESQVAILCNTLEWSKYHTKKKKIPLQINICPWQSVSQKGLLPYVLTLCCVFPWMEQMQCRRLWCNNVDGAHKGCRTQHTPWADGTECETGKASNVVWCLSSGNRNAPRLGGFSVVCVI